ncbi:endonuclease/exonuclease/phosphatase family protein [Jannaschia sp. R86511]|uniref:endonuclease/exonuclease/phosphatase family protein n=1 Tax=Jannaschia sp. R86511 TaxID=3093853 RepID=UPI0036D2F457
MATAGGPQTGRRRTGRVLLAVGVLPAVGALPVTLVRLLGRDGVTPVAQVVGLTPFAGLVLLVAVLPLLVVAFPLRGPRWPAAVVVCALLLHGWWLVPRDVPAAPADGTSVTVMSVNARFGNADPGRVVELVRDNGVDVLLVQELTPGLAAGLEASGLTGLLPEAVTTVRPGPDGTGTFTRWSQDRLPAPATTFATVRSVVTVPGARPLTLTNAHTWPPLPGTVDRWRDDHRLLLEAVSEGPDPQVLAGDLNATRDHARFRALTATGLRDAAARQVWARTWPANQLWPPLLALDHVLVDPATGVDQVQRFPVDGTDHLAVVAELTVARPPGA